MTKVNMIIVIVLLLVGSIPTQAAETDITVHTIYIPGLLTHEHTGPFADLIREIGRRTDFNIDIKILPPMRQRLLFNKKQIDIIFPMVASSFTEEVVYDRSSSFYEKKYCVFTKVGDAIVQPETDLLKLNGPIGLTYGYSYPTQLFDDSRLVIDYAPSDDQNMKKLSLGRIAAFVVEENSGISALRNTALEGELTYDVERPLFTEEVFFAFQETKKLFSVRKAISLAIDEMKQDGTLKRILKDLHPADQSRYSSEIK